MSIKSSYSTCHVVNLLGKSEGEFKVSSEYDKIVKQLNSQVIITVLEIPPH